MKRINILTLSFILLFGITGCDIDDEDDSSSGEGTIVGNVDLVDSLGNSVKDLSGVKVSLEGTNFSTMSSVDGGWILSKIPTRTYTILFEKSGFGTVKHISYQFVGGDTAYHDPVIMSMPVQREIHNFLCNIGGGAIIINGCFPSGDEHSYIVSLSLDSASLFSRPNTKLPYLSFVDRGIDASHYFGITWIPIERLRDAGVSSGSKVYSAIYIVGLGLRWTAYSKYFDPSNGEMVFPSAGPPSQILSFIMP
jgi:hypothetical protein